MKIVSKDHISTHILLRESDTAHQVSETRIGMETVQGRLDLQPQQANPLCIAFFEPEEGLLLIAQPGVVLRHLPGKIELQVARITL